MKKLLLPFIALSFFISANAQDQVLLKYIPSDVAFVSGLNSGQINGKIDLEAMKKSPIGQQISKEFSREMGKDEFTQKIWNSPKEAIGLDPLGGAYLFVESYNAGDSMFTGMLFKMDDVKKFESTLKEQMEEKYDEMLIKGKKFKALNPDNDVIMAWNKEAFLFLVAVEYRARKGLKKKTEQAFTQKANITSNSNFMIAANKKADLFGWMNMEKVNDEIYANFKKEMGSSLDGKTRKDLGLPKLADHYNHVFINFINGKVLIDSKSFVSEEYASLNKRIADNTFNTELFKYIPNDKLIGALSMSVNVNETKNVIEKYLDEYLDEYTGEEKAISYREEANKSLSAFNTDYESVWGIFEGDMLLSFNGMKVVKKTYMGYDYELDEEGNYVEVEKEMSYNKEIPLVSFCATLKDAAKVKTILNKLEEDGVFINKGNYYELIKGGEDETMFAAITKDNILVLTNDKDILGGLPNGFPKNKMVSGEALEHISGHPVNMLFDVPLFVENLRNALPDGESGKEAEKVMDLSAKTFKHAFFFSKNPDGKTIAAESGVEFFAENENSLMTLFRYANDLFVIFDR